jgi:hypothetical protein
MIWRSDEVQRRCRGAGIEVLSCQMCCRCALLSMVGAEVIVQVQQRYSCAGVEKVMRQRRCRAGAVVQRRC